MIGASRVSVVVAAAMVAALLLAVGRSPAATSSTVVGATVPSATNLGTTGCASGVAGSTSFGSVTPGSSTVTTSDCTVTFGSSNDTARLRIQQDDGLGAAMYQPTTGVPDTGFDGDGRRVTATASGTGSDWANAVTVQPDGRIVTTGTCDMGAVSGEDICVARYEANGNLDASFDSDGLVSLAISPGAADDWGYAVAVQPDGKIVTAGSCDFGATARDICVARLNANGSLDTTFDADGIAVTAVGTGSAWDGVTSLSVQPDGRIVTAGSCDIAATGSDFCVTRLLANGSLDASFGSNGVVTTALTPGTGFDRAWSMDTQADGKIVVGGYCPMGASGNDMCFTRYTTDGSLDPSFDGDGRAMIDVAPGSGTDNAAGTALQADGKIVAGGYCNMGGATGWDFCAVRMASNGSLDATFDGDGRVTTTIGPGVSDDSAEALVIQGDGTIVMAGYCDMGGVAGYDICLTRHRADGSLDTSFGGDGMVTADIAPAAGWEAAYGLALGADGAIVTAGECEMSSPAMDNCLTAWDDGGGVSQYQGGSADWATVGTSHFAACLRSVGSATASWTVNATCPASNGAYWNAVPTTPVQLASAASGVTTASANLRFGLRTSSSQAPGAYVAPIAFTVVAP